MKENNIKIGIVGYESQESWTPEMMEAFQDLLYPDTIAKDGTVTRNPNRGNIIKFSINAITNLVNPLEKNEVSQHKKPLSLRWAVSERLDLDIYIVNQTMLHFYNDLQFENKIVIYLHMELPSGFHQHSAFTNEPWSRLCDIMLFKLPEVPATLHQREPWEYSKIQHVAWLPPEANPKRYSPAKKKDIHISLVGAPDDTFDIKQRDYMWNEILQKEFNKLRDAWISYDIGEYYPTPVTKKTYKDVLERSEFMVIPFWNGVYCGRRQFECLAAKTIPILYIENDKAKNTCEALGFTNDNSYFFHDIEELKTREFVYDPLMAENGHTLLMNRHTHKHRAMQILREIDIWKKKLESK